MFRELTNCHNTVFSPKIVLWFSPLVCCLFVYIVLSVHSVEFFMSYYNVCSYTGQCISDNVLQLWSEQHRFTSMSLCLPTSGWCLLCWLFSVLNDFVLISTRLSRNTSIFSYLVLHTSVLQHGSFFGSGTDHLVVVILLRHWWCCACCSIFAWRTLLQSFIQIPFEMMEL